jgi:hypothetical protein
MTLDEFRAETSHRLEREYSLTWADACGDDAILLKALHDQWTPEQFVSWFASKYDLQARSEAPVRLSRL